MARRQKLIAGIEEQLKVAAAAYSGDIYEVQRKAWATNEQGAKVQVEKMGKVRPWFFEQDGSWYVNCKYGNRVLELGEKGNAVFVEKLDDVKGVLENFKKATAEGEFAQAIESISKSRSGNGFSSKRSKAKIIAGS